MYVLMLKLNVFMPKWVRKIFYVYIPIGIAVDCMSIILLVLAWVVCPSILLDEGENLTNFIIGKSILFTNFSSRKKPVQNTIESWK